eukprot:gene25315-10971_t
METERRVLEEKVRKAEAECNRLKIRLNSKAEAGGESFSLAEVRAEIQKAAAKCTDPAAKRKMLNELSLKWHPDKNPVMSSLATEISKMINVTRADAAANVSFLQRKIVGLEHQVDGLITKADNRQIQVDELKASAVAAAVAGDKQQRNISELERKLGEKRKFLQDKGEEAEAAKQRIEGLEHEVDALLVKADVRQIEMERLRVAATAGEGGNQQQKKIHALELAMEQQRRVLEEKVRKAEAECNRLKNCLDLKAEVGGESISLADVRAEIQKAAAKCPDPAAKRKMLNDLSLKWHPDKNPVMSSLATEISKLINVLFRP